jgi:hypothetical protein
VPEQVQGAGAGERDAALPSPGVTGWGWRRRVFAAVLIGIAGVGGSLTAALLWRNSVRAHNRQSFQTSAASVSGSLETLIRRDTDFVGAVRAVLAMEPNVSASRFHQWSSRLEDHEAQLGSLGALVVKSVPAGRLRAFEAQRRRDPAFRALVGGQVEPVARTGRSHYCLLSGGSASIPTLALQGAGRLV